MPREEIHVQGDRVDLRLVRIAPVAGPPVILVPGLAAGPEGFAINSGRSLVERLVAAGRTPWWVDFHVHWRSQAQDAAALLHALEQSLAELRRHADVDLSEVDAIGHSLGGILLLALAADEVPLRRIVTLASALDFRKGPSPLPRLLSLSPKGIGPLRGGPLASGPLPGGLPTRRLAHAGASLFGRGLRLPVERDQFHPGSTPGPVVRRYLRESVRDVPLALVLDLAELFTAEGLRLGRSGRPLRDAAEDILQPVLMVAARQDRQCPVDGVRSVARRLPGGQLLEVGGQGARGEGYGHVDVLTGSRAGTEVFDPVLAFLTQDSPASSPSPSSPSPSGSSSSGSSSSPPQSPPSEPS